MSSSQVQIALSFWMDAVDGASLFFMLNLVKMKLNFFTLILSLYNSRHKSFIKMAYLL